MPSRYKASWTLPGKEEEGLLVTCNGESPEQCWKEQQGRRRRSCLGPGLLVQAVCLVYGQGHTAAVMNPSRGRSRTAPTDIAEVEQKQSSAGRTHSKPQQGDWLNGDGDLRRFQRRESSSLKPRRKDGEADVEQEKGSCTNGGCWLIKESREEDGLLFCEKDEQDEVRVVMLQVREENGREEDEGGWSREWGRDEASVQMRRDGDGDHCFVKRKKRQRQSESRKRKKKKIVNKRRRIQKRKTWIVPFMAKKKRQ